MKDPQVQSQHQQNETDECHPNPDHQTPPPVRVVQSNVWLSSVDFRESFHFPQGDGKIKRHTFAGFPATCHFD
jgi:hypothetical protein